MKAFLTRLMKGEYAVECGMIAALILVAIVVGVQHVLKSKTPRQFIRGRGVRACGQRGGLAKRVGAGVWRGKR